jgi:hypothetical protein
VTATIPAKRTGMNEMYFTDSPYERIMTAPAEIRPESDPLPPGHPCRGCNFAPDGICLGTCWRKFFEENMRAVKAARNGPPFG